ncbi:MAG: hypothetical protein PWR22_329 [Moorella sp. (in: firmicutes)]|jgi:RraA family protein|uniref:RraA family protein n=1 Tax=Moorella sp. E306M TaxID=2572683 RepID=UPI0010FFB638|nr:RraA family protein [Moorella sp. E306M]MDK2815701.1 hypothetical protein [Moorella sp. (in: firmicutes)]GEA17448.1 methyltransferase [Moorella sp. E306M]
MYGFRIIANIERASKELIEGFRGLCTGNIADVLGRFHTTIGLRHFNNPGLHMVGTAFTVRTTASDNLMIHKAINMAEPGDVIVIEGEGNISRALLGEIMCRMAQARGLAGFVVDGAIRDAAGIRNLDFPVYAKGINPAGPFKEGPGEINVPICCAGAVVHPGDILVGDDDGVVVIPKEQAEEVLVKAKEKAVEEAEIFKQIAAGTVDRTWVDKILQAKGCKIII